MEITINTWHCEDEGCGAEFYKILGDEPSYCPFCNGVESADSKVLTAIPVSFRSIIK